jgi:hypothetical protein
MRCPAAACLSTTSSELDLKFETAFAVVFGVRFADVCMSYSLHRTVRYRTYCRVDIYEGRTSVVRRGRVSLSGVASRVHKSFTSHFALFFTASDQQSTNGKLATCTVRDTVHRATIHAPVLLPPLHTIIFHFYHGNISLLVRQESSFGGTMPEVPFPSAMQRPYSFPGIGGPSNAAEQPWNVTSEACSIK